MLRPYHSQGSCRRFTVVYDRASFVFNDQWQNGDPWFYHDLESARTERKKSSCRLLFLKKDGTEILVFAGLPVADAEQIAADVNLCLRKVQAAAVEALLHADRMTKWEQNQRLAALSSRRARDILQDSRGSDRKYKRTNNLDSVFIDSVIRNPCHYCGVAPDMTVMSLDRIDPMVGHMKDNVLPSCVNCNLTRGTMPFQAWMLLAPKMREARELRLLAGWDRTNRMKQVEFSEMQTPYRYHGRSFRKKYAGAAGNVPDSPPVDSPTFV